GAALLVLHRRDDTGRLVQGEGHLGLVELEPDTVDVDDGGGRVDPGAELDHPAVHRDTAVDDELLAGAPRPVAGSGQDLLQSDTVWAVDVVAHLSSSSRSSRESRSGRQGASGGRSSSDPRPIRSRK